jgi:hypothetical protein
MCTWLVIKNIVDIVWSNVVCVYCTQAKHATYELIIIRKNKNKILWMTKVCQPKKYVS